MVDKKLSIERLKAGEWQQYKELRLRSLQESPRAFGMSYEEESLRPKSYWKNLAQRYAIGFYDAMYIAKLGGTMIGSTGFFNGLYKKKRHTTTIINVYVDKEHRGQGIARQLFSHALDQIKKDPRVKKLKLTVIPDQKEAVKLYESFGFVVVGKMERELKIGEEYFDEWMMELWLG